MILSQLELGSFSLIEVRQISSILCAFSENPSSKNETRWKRSCTKGCPNGPGTSLRSSSQARVAQVAQWERVNKGMYAYLVCNFWRVYKGLMRLDQTLSFPSIMMIVTTGQSSQFQVAGRCHDVGLCSHLSFQSVNDLGLCTTIK